MKENRKYSVLNNLFNFVNWYEVSDSVQWQSSVWKLWSVLDTDIREPDIGLRHLIPDYGLEQGLNTVSGTKIVWGRNSVNESL